LKPSSSSDCKCIVGHTPGLGSLNTAALPGLQAENHTIWRGSGPISHTILGLQIGWGLDLSTGAL